MSDFNSLITDDIKKAFTESKESALKFAEHFLVDPTLNKPFKANYPQKFILSSNKRDVWICVSRRTGKMQPLYSLVYTPSGPKPMEEIVIGDLVCTPEGTAKVTHLHPHGQQTIYRFTLDDGTTIDSGSEHEWEVWGNLYSRGPRGASKAVYGNRLLTSKKIAETLTRWGEFEYKINPIQPINYLTVDLSINPYLLGVLLGDGCLRTLEITSADPEIINRIKEDTNFDFVEKEVKISKARRYFIRNTDLKQSLFKLGLEGTKSATKFIPKEYLYSDISQRIALLQGLMDTDGSKDSKTTGRAEFCSKSEQLAKDVLELSRSLGCKATLHTNKSFYTKNGQRISCGHRYRVTIRNPENIQIFSLPRKQNGYIEERYLRRTIVKVEILDKTEMQCITIDDEKHLYLTDGCTPTHNCVTGETLVIDPDTLQPIPIAQAFSVTKTLCFDFKTNETIWTPCTWINSGVKKCLKLSLGSGSSVALTDDHLVFTAKSGWIKAKSIKIGDKLLAPTTLEIFGDLEPRQDELELDLDYTLGFKKLSADVFKYTKHHLTIFLREFFLTTGRLLHNDKCIAFMLWNKDLSHDIRHIINRLGIDSRVDQDGNLFIDEDIDKSQFLRTIGFDHPVTEVRSPRKWDIVIGITNIGNQSVYDLSVEHDDHNFIGNDIVLHNSYATTIIALWHAITKPDQKIVVFAPGSPQINEWFEALDKWISKNPFLQSMKDPAGGNHKAPQKRSFINGSTIQGYLMGLTGAIEGAKRGITADVNILDECQLFDEEDWKVLTPIMTGDQYRTDRIRNYMAGTTPNNPDNYYYEKIYKLPPSNKEEVIFIPITKNLDYTPEKVEEMRLATPIVTWNTEYLLELGEVDKAVFRKTDIEVAGRHDWEYNSAMIDSTRVRFMGVDWDKTQAGTNIAVFQYDTLSQNVQLIYREEVDTGEFTYLNAVQKIHEIYDAFRPELVVADQGQGEVQWELLKSESELRGTGLSSRLIKKAFNEKIEVMNYETGDIEKKYIKPFLVGQLQYKFQNRKFQYPVHDEVFRNQLLAYKVVRQTELTTKFTTHNEHIIDCCLFAMYGIWYLYENQFDSKYAKEHNTYMRVFKDTEIPITEFQEKSFFDSIYGERTNYPGVQIPRTPLDAPFKYKTSDDFYIDDD